MARPTRSGLMNNLAQRKVKRLSGLSHEGQTQGYPQRGGLPPGLTGRALPPGLNRLQAAGKGPFKPGGPFAGAAQTGTGTSTPSPPAGPGLPATAGAPDDGQGRLIRMDDTLKKRRPGLYG